MKTLAIVICACLLLAAAAFVLLRRKKNPVASVEAEKPKRTEPRQTVGFRYPSYSCPATNTPVRSRLVRECDSAPSPSYSDSSLIEDVAVAVVEAAIVESLFSGDSNDSGSSFDSGSSDSFSGGGGDFGGGGASSDW
jgi:uncharacterized membrane protein YgcG